MDNVETLVLRGVEQNWKREVGFLRNLVRQRSTLGNEADAQRVVAAELREMGLDVDWWQVNHAAIATLPGYSPVEWSYEGRPNVAATWRSPSNDGRSLILNGHIDVVPATPEHHWTYDPWDGQVADGRMYGRGAADMKAGIAAMVYAVRALREADIRLKGNVTLETVIEEECTGNGTLATLARGYTADAAIIPEPFGQVGLEAQLGVMWARVTVRGAAAHVERADEAVNAITKAYWLIQAIEELEAEVNALEDRPPHYRNIPHPLNYNVGTIKAGDWPSSVPSECTFEVRIAAYPGADLDEVQTQFRTRLAESSERDAWLLENPPQVDFYAIRGEGCVVDRNEELFLSLEGAHKKITRKHLDFIAFTGLSDIRFFNLYHDTPATCYGPAAGNLHAPDEWVNLTSLEATTKVLALTIMDWCGRE
jgi:acetylornithine deacetylase